MAGNQNKVAQLELSTLAEQYEDKIKTGLAIFLVIHRPKKEPLDYIVI